MTTVDLLLIVVALAGHLAFWIGRSNALHATALPEWYVRSLSAASHATSLSIIILFGVWFALGGTLSRPDAPWTFARVLAAAYACWCYVVVAGPVRRWFVFRFLAGRPAAMLSARATMVDMRKAVGHLPVRGWKGNLLAQLPLNDVLTLAVTEKEIAIANLPTALDGLSIAHLSDFHTGDKLTTPFFEEVVRQANALDCDLIAITGDLFERQAGYECVASVFAQLRARHGVYFVLGNHDAYLHDTANIRRMLTAAGLVDLGGTWKELSIRGERVVLAGNELPWTAPAADMTSAPPSARAGGPMRILLAHTPDEVAWARRHDFDLALAGHTHGGQVRFPLIGPVLVPSRLDVSYSAGTFDMPPTVLHVSRGISGKTPLRLRCTPEITRLVLRAGTSRK